MSKNEKIIKQLLNEIKDVENHIKILKITLKELKERLRIAVESDED